MSEHQPQLDDADRARIAEAAARELAGVVQRLASELVLRGDASNEQVVAFADAVREEAVRSPDVERGRGLKPAIAWPLRRLLDPRFRGLAQQIDVKHADLVDRLDAARDESLRLNHERALMQTDLAVQQEISHTTLTDVDRLLRAHMEATAEQTTVFGRGLLRLEGEIRALSERIERLERETG